MQKQILFVCLGNICRSPLAEAIFKRQIAERGLENKYSADSCGTSNFHIGDRPDPRTIRNARQHEVEINHIGRQISVHDFSDFDLILAMDHSNFQYASDLSGKVSQPKAELKLIRSFDPDAFGLQDVPDPWYGSEQGFEEVFQMLWRSCEELINQLEKGKAMVKKTEKLSESSL